MSFRQFTATRSSVSPVFLLADGASTTGISSSAAVSQPGQALRQVVHELVAQFGPPWPALWEALRACYAPDELEAARRLAPWLERAGPGTGARAGRPADMRAAIADGLSSSRPRSTRLAPTVSPRFPRFALRLCCRDRSPRPTPLRRFAFRSREVLGMSHSDETDVVLAAARRRHLPRAQAAERLA